MYTKADVDASRLWGDFGRCSTSAGGTNRHMKIKKPEIHFIMKNIFDRK